MEKIIGVIDEPVRPNVGENDNLDIEIHSKSLIEFVQKTETPITVGIQGEWGSGKTSLLNSIHYDFEKRQPTFKQIWINSWEYSLLSTPEESLLKIVNKIIDELIDTDTNNRYKEKLKHGAGRIIKGALRIGAQVALGDEAAKVTDELLESGHHSISALRNTLNDLVTEIATRQNNPLKKVIIYVDDLDRIEPRNAVAILELLKNIFNVQNCVFILAIDYQVVVKGLEHKFGKPTNENEWEFRAFFDKIIQLPFMMPMGQYNIGKYIHELLVNIGFIEDDGIIDNEEITKIIMWTIGGNPRSIKRLVNSVSLIQIFVNQKKIISEKNDYDDNERYLLSDHDEKFLLFSFLCIQIAYPLVYSLLVEEPDFVKWDDELAYRKTQRSEEYIDVFKGEFENAQNTHDFNEKWEKALYRICYELPRLKSMISEISKCLSYIKDVTLNNNQENIGATIAYILTQTSVTSVSSNSQGQQVSNRPKSNYGRELIEIVKEISEKMDENGEITIEKLKKSITKIVKQESGIEIPQNSLNAITAKATINDRNRCYKGVNEKNVDKFNVFYLVDGKNKKTIRKYLPGKPPIGYKVYYMNRNTKEICDQTKS